MRIILIIIILCFNVCATWKPTSCQRNTEAKRQSYSRSGIPYRIGHGFYKGTAHRWLEYYDGYWRMAKDTIRNVYGGWRVEEYGGYEVTWYEYDNPRWAAIE